MSEISFLVRNICQESLHSRHQIVISTYPSVTQYEPYIIISQDLTLIDRERSPEQPKPCAQGTARSQIIELCAMSLELPPLVRSGIFLYSLSRGRGLNISISAAVFAPLRKWVILNYIALGSII